jgi:hypothetical protein
MINGLKLFFLKIKLKNELNRKKTKTVFVSKKISSIGVLIDGNIDFDELIFDSLLKDLNIPTSMVNILVLDKKKENLKLYKAINVSLNEITLFGRLPEFLNSFLKKDFDILINFFEKNTLLTFLSSLSKAKFRLGFSSTNQSVNDLILNLRPIDSKLFKNQAIKFIKIIFKI